MVPGPDMNDIKQRGQLPVFIPNYYRGAYSYYPDRAGRSSQLFNTGTTPWFYRSLIDGLFGLRGSREGLVINPQLPRDWNEASVIRRFRGAEFEVHIDRVEGANQMTVHVDGVQIEGNTIKGIREGVKYKVLVEMP